MRWQQNKIRTGLVMSFSLKEQIPNLLEATPGLSYEAYHRGKLVLKEDIGEVYKYYDLASLTKILFTTNFFMHLHQIYELNIDDRISSVIPEYKYFDHSIKDLLGHAVGYNWWNDYYKSIWNESLEFTESKQWPKLESILLNEEVDIKNKGVYSDLDFLFLGLFLRRYFGNNLIEIFSRYKEDLKLESCFFQVDNLKADNLKDFAPTEFSEIRKDTMQSQVHDENTFALGGVSTHAGLFGTIKDVSEIALQYRNALKNESSIFQRETLKLFISDSMDRKVGDWGLGFMKPSFGSSSCGKYFSTNSFGHTGFTGTSLWVDPDADLFVVILSNRINYGRDNKAFVPMRAEIHNAIYKEVIGV
ncbi:MAG: serine hydrolase [Bdellovibrionales bacterium]